MTVAKLNRAQLKEEAREVLMQGIANQLGYYEPSDDGRQIPQEQLEEFRAAMQREADRVARLFGYEKAWSN